MIGCHDSTGRRGHRGQRQCGRWPGTGSRRCLIHPVRNHGRTDGGQLLQGRIGGWHRHRADGKARLRVVCRHVGHRHAIDRVGWAAKRARGNQGDASCLILIRSARLQRRHCRPIVGIVLGDRPIVRHRRLLPARVVRSRRQKGRGSLRQSGRQ